MHKDVLLRALKKCYIIICCFSNKGEEYIHASLNRKIIEYITKKPREKREIVSTHEIHTLFDLKNEVWMDLDTKKITQFELPGLPHEVGPHYVVNPAFEGRVLSEEFFNFQKPELDKLLELKTFQTNNDTENNFIPSSLLLNIKLINFAAQNKQNFINNKQTILEKDSISKEICSSYMPEIKFRDKAYIQKLFETKIDKNIAVINVKYLKQIDNLQNILLANKLELDNLDEEDSKNLVAYKDLWKGLIDSVCDNLINELTQDNDKFKKEFPELSSEEDEVKFVINTLKNTSKDIDFNKFKTPRELFSFWPPILYPAPEYVLDSVFLKNEF